MASEPEVTVVVPTRNRWDLLARHALASALGQEDVRLEIVVCDDGSTDGSEERVAAHQDSRVRLVARKERGGQAVARNAGVAAARAPWVAFLDDDDVWAPRKLRCQLDAALAREAVLTYTGLAVVDEHWRLLDLVPAPDPETLAAELLTRNVLRAGSSTVLARTEAVRELGGFDPNLNELTDWDLWIRLAQAGPAAACSEVLVAYFTHAENRRVVDESDIGAEFAYLRRKHGSSGPADRLLQANYSRWVAMGHLRRRRRLRAASVYLRSGVATRNAGNLLRGAGALAGAGAFERRRRLRAGEAPAWIERFRS